ncbi:MAG TPA: DUF1800 domain-containing protein [Sphingobacteriaceae bacterium]
MDLTRQRLKHLHSRAGFGIRHDELSIKKNYTIKKAVDELISRSATITPLHITINARPQKGYQKLTGEEKKLLLREARESVRNLNTSWLIKLASSDEQLREKMTLFWHGHFACRSTNPLYLQQLNNIHREHALGNFRTMVLEVAKAPAMLQFLNNQQNRKDHPNENFARELMELFTLGHGNYTENDIKEAARAFTGWAYNRSGEFQFRKLIHDNGSKTVFGKTGNWGGDEIIDIILSKPEAATFIAGKIYNFFVSDTPDENRIGDLGRFFFEKNYDIAALMRKIFMSDWFYDASNAGNKIKSPVELLAGLTRQFYITYQNPRILLQFQQALGQTLFFPPNVAGWAGGRSWIDSSSLMLRLKIPSLILNGGVIEFDGKADPEDEAAIAMSRIKRNTVSRRVQATADWLKFSGSFSSKNKPEDVAAFLLQPLLTEAVRNTVKTNTDIKNTAIKVVSMPEYQLG